MDGKLCLVAVRKLKHFILIHLSLVVDLLCFLVGFINIVEAT